jgi:hypothetical protein
MAKKNAAAKAVNPDNVYEFDICGETVTCAASLGASVIYKDEFIGRLDAPYTGILETDLSVIYRRTLPLVTVEVETDADGNAIVGDDGKPVAKVGEDGTYVEVASDFDGPCAAMRNPDYYGMDVVAALRFVWAMARAAKSVDASWDEWSTAVMARPMSIGDQKRIFDKALLEVALTHWFLDQEGRVGAQERDA